MRGKKRFAAAAIVVAAAMATGVAGGCESEKDKNPPLTENELSGTCIADFTEGEQPAFFSSDGWTNGSVFNTWWSSSQVSYDEGALTLSVAENPDGDEQSNNGYFGGEARSHQYFGYGDYEVSMKPSDAAGTASAFFTCTGSYDLDENGNPNPWDEIDIEFLGKDTTQVQFNYYVDGAGGHEYWYDLGFDASEEFHDYGFRWTENYIAWFVDGVPVYKVEASEETPLPSTPGRILMNNWVGTTEAEGWMGAYDGDGSEKAQYGSVTVSATPIGEIPETETAERFTGDWSKSETVAAEFTSSDGTHTVTADGTASNIAYSGVAGNSYSNVSADIESPAADNNWVHLTLKNNGTETSSVRINVVGNGSAINAYGYGDGELLRTPVGEGSFVELAAGQTVTVEIKYTGAAKTFELMIDSSRGTSTEYSGDITVDQIKFAAQGEIVIPEEPDSVNNGVTVNGAVITFVGNTGLNGYVINTDNENNTMNVTYENIVGGTYMNINAPVSGIAATRNVFTTKVTNNGENDVALRIDIQSGVKVNNTMACNVSATQDGVAVFTDTDWGGSVFSVPAGKTVTAEVTYDTSRGPAEVYFYLDSAMGGDTATHKGDVTFSDMAFGGEGSVAPEQPEVPEGGSVSLVFNSQMNYNVDKSGQPADAVTVTYEGINGGSYANIFADIADVSVGKNTFSLKITNNSGAAATIRVDLKGTKAGETEACNVSAVATGGTGLRTDTVYGGTYITIAAGEEVTLIITYDGEGAHGAATQILAYFDSATYGDVNVYGGNITLSEFTFSSVG